MKIYIPRVLFFLLLVLGAAKANSQSTASSTNQQTASKMIRHVVLFKFKDTSTPEQVKEVEEAFKRLPKQINTVKNLEWGTNVSPENLAQGFTHCFLVTFDNAAGRDAYLIHPAHVEFGKILRPYLDKVLVIDFENKN